MSTFGVGLVAYNMKSSDIEALSKSLGFTKPNYQVVVDNSLTNKTKEIFESYNWTYIHNPSNPGFGSSHNIIFDRFSGEADYHLIVNPDISFSNNIVSELIRFLEKNRQAGCVMPKVYYSDGRIQRLAKLLPSPLDFLVRRMPLGLIKRVFNKRLELHKADYENGVFRVPFLSGCFLLFRTSVINKCGFFDERFFMYTEDTDLSRRLWISGYSPYYYGKVSVTHGFEKGSAKNLKLLRIHLQSAYAYFNKWGWIDKERRKINKECLSQFD